MEVPASRRICVERGVEEAGRCDRYFTAPTVKPAMNRSRNRL
jgi:hypothetical protein